MSFSLARCPACGGELNIVFERDYFFCPYCGAKVVKNEQKIVVEEVHRYIDEAAVRKEENQRLQFKEKQEAEKNRKEREERSSKYTGLFLMIFGGVLMLLSLFVQEYLRETLLPLLFPMILFGGVLFFRSSGFLHKK